MVERWLGVSTAQTGGRQFMGSLARTAATAYIGSRIAKGLQKALKTLLKQMVVELKVQLKLQAT